MEVSPSNIPFVCSPTIPQIERTQRGLDKRVREANDEKIVVPNKGDVTTYSLAREREGAVRENSTLARHILNLHSGYWIVYGGVNSPKPFSKGAGEKRFFGAK